MEIFLRTVLIGLVKGSVYALAATGLVLTYKTSRILNLGFGAMAMFTTYVYWNLAVTWGWPLWISALVVILLVAPALGFFLDSQLFRRIEDQPPVIGLIATVGLIVLFQGVVFRIWGTDTKTVPSLFSQRPIHIFGGATIGVDELAILVIALGAAATLAVMLRYTRLGVAFRAVVDNRPVAGLMSLNTNLISGLGWALGTSFAAMTGILLTPRLFLEPITLPFFIIAFLLGAAMVGYLRSLPLAFAGGILIGLIQSFLVQYGTFRGVIGNLGNAVPFLMVTILLLFAPRRIRQASTGGSFVVRVRELAEHSSRTARTAVGLAVFGALALVPALSQSVSLQKALTIGLVQGIIFLSIVVLTGYSGQISLGVTAFMGIGAFATAHFVADLGWPAWAALLAGMLAAVPAGALIGVIAVRLHGLYLALITLAFAFMAQDLFFKNAFVSGREGSIPVPRPSAFKGDTAFYYFALLALAVCAIVAVNLRSGRAGRVLAGIRDSETATRSLGINVAKYKVLIFGLSALIAALGGILLSMVTESAGRLDFLPLYGIIFVTVAVVGGIFHIGGAIAGGLLFGLYPKVFANNSFMLKNQLILFGLGATLALAKNPEGMFGEMRRGGHAILRPFQRRAAPSEPLPVAGAQE